MEIQDIEAEIIDRVERCQDIKIIMIHQDEAIIGTMILDTTLQEYLDDIQMIDTMSHRTVRRIDIEAVGQINIVMDLLLIPHTTLRLVILPLLSSQVTN